MIIESRPRLYKPPFGSVEIDRAHRLAAGLRWYSPLTMYRVLNEMVSDKRISPNGVGVTGVVKSLGPAVHFNGSSTAFFDMGEPPTTIGFGALTVACQVFFTGAGTDNPFIAKAGNVSAGYALKQASAGGTIDFQGPSTGNQGATTTGTYLNRWVTILGTWDGANAVVLVYDVKGALLERVSTATTGGWGSDGQNIRVTGWNDSTTTQQTCDMTWVGIWNRAFSIQDGRWLAAEPYAFLKPRPAVRYWGIIPADAGGMLSTGGAVLNTSPRRQILARFP